jgi:hypothetical protein
MDDSVPYLQIPSPFEPWVQARVPENEDIQILPVAHNQSESVSGVVKRCVLSVLLAGQPEDNLVLVPALHTAFDERICVYAQSWR